MRNKIPCKYFDYEIAKLSFLIDSLEARSSTISLAKYFSLLIHLLISTLFKSNLLPVPLRDQTRILLVLNW